MTYSGRYTGYQYYPDRQFNEAVDARTPPYTQRQYQCPHSSRTLQFAAQDTPARQHYDAAVTTCCDEPVRPFGVHPQYEELDRPMRAKDCGDPAARMLCNTFFLSSPGAPIFPARTAPQIAGIQVGCLQQCGDDQFGSLQWNETWRGTYGTFVMRSRTEDRSVVDFHGEADQEFYNRCGGTEYRNESVCGGQGSIHWAIKAEYGGAYPCDCCNDSGQGITPNPIISWAHPSPTWENSVSIGNVSVNATCGGAKLAATWKGSGSSIVWSPPPSYYYVGNSSRYTWGTLIQVGDANSPICCGGTIGFAFDNGCGWSKSDSLFLSTKIVSSALTPAEGTDLSNNVDTLFKIDDACAHAYAANISGSNAECIQNIYAGGLVRNDGYATKNLRPLTQAGSCSRCCGRGKIRVTANNGCGYTISQDYPIHTKTPPSFSGVVGRCWSCQYSGWDWVRGQEDIACNGGLSGYIDRGHYLTEEACLQAIDDLDQSELCGAACCVEIPTGTGDCHRVVYTTSNDACCNWLGDAENPVYHSGNAASCCP
jgi:hypothetical protein